MYILGNFCLFLIFVTETISRTDDGQPRPKYIFINVELISTFLLYRGLVHHHHRILNVYQRYVKILSIMFIVHCTWKIFYQNVYLSIFIITLFSATI